MKGEPRRGSSGAGCSKTLNVEGRENSLSNPMASSKTTGSDQTKPRTLTRGIIVVLVHLYLMLMQQLPR